MNQPNAAVAAEEIFQQAAALHEQGKLDQAEQLYRAILWRDEDDLGALYNLGILRFQRGDYDGAVAFTREVVRQRPDLTTAYNTLAVALKHLGHLVEAESCCREALRLAPAYAEAHNTLGDTLIALGRFAEAEACCREALRLTPEYAEAHNNLGTVLLALGRSQEAESCCRQVLCLRPGNVLALGNLGIALLFQGKLSQAAACFGRAVALKSDDAAALITWFQITRLFCDSTDCGNVFAPEGLIPAHLRPQVKRALSKTPFRHFCPFCNSRLRIFLPNGIDFPVLKEKRVVGGGFRHNVLCLVCGSFDRERLVYLYLLHKTDLFLRSPQKVLHIAPERQLSNVLLEKPNLHCLTGDLYAEDVMVRMDITKIPYPDASFDVIICNHVLEHVIDDRQAMRELRRILKPEGWAILQVPLSLALKSTYEDPSITTRDARETAFGQWNHVRIYAAADYADRLAHAGFAVEIFRWVTRPDEFGGPTNRFGLNEDETLYIGRPRAEALSGSG